METFKTTDYRLAAYLLIRNITVDITANPLRPGKVEFLAPASEETLRAVSDFSLDKPVPVQSYNESLEAVKDRMMEISRGRR